MENKKIFIAADIFPPEIGGPASYAADLADALYKEGYAVRVLHYGHLHIKKKKKPYSIYKVSLRWPLLIRYFFYFLKLFIFAYNADIIYAQGPVTAGLPSFWVSRLLGKKLVVKVVGDYAWEQAQVNNRTRQDIDDWQEKPVYKSAKIDKIGLMYRFERRIVSAADKVIVPAHYLKEIVLGWGAREENVEVIYNAVSLECTSQLNKIEAKEAIGVSGNILLGVGRFTPWKGFDFLIKLMPDLLKINPDFKLIIIGDGPYLKEYQKIIQERKLLEKVILPGSVSRTTLCNYFRAAEMFLLNSGYEGLPHIVLEAMHHKLPVLVADKGGNSEVVDNEINGLLLPLNDKKAWVDAIVRIWQDKALKSRLSKNAVPQLPCFEFDEMIDRTIKLLNSI